MMDALCLGKNQAEYDAQVIAALEQIEKTGATLNRKYFGKGE